MTEAQYLSIRYSERLAEAGAEPSVGSVGDSYNNGLAETIIGLYKTKVIHRRGPWRHLEAVEIRHAGMGRLFQSPSVAGADRQCTAGGARGVVLSFNE